MKVNTKIGAIALLTTVFTLSACVNAKKTAKNFGKGSSYQIQPEVLELRGDSVEYQGVLTIAPKALDKKASVQLNPLLTYGDTMKYKGPQTTVLGEEAPGPKVAGATTITSEQGGKVAFRDKFLYDPAMLNSNLYLIPVVRINGIDPVQDRCVPLDTVYLAPGIVTTHLLGQAGEESQESGDPYEPIRRDEIIELYYLINSSTFNPRFTVRSAGINNQTQLKKMSNLTKDPDYLITGISIKGMASPDGELKRNTKLSEQRTKATFKHLTKELKKLGFKEVNDSAFALNSTMTEDWEGWKALVEASTLPDKNEILAIMNSGMGEEEKEKEIKTKHAKSYNQMKTTMLPLLRRATVSFDRQQPLKTNEELLTYKNKLNELEVVELLQLARVIAEPSEKIAVYEEVVRRDANDWRGPNNIGYVHLKGGDYATALPFLEKANTLSPGNAVVLNNLGVASTLAKDYVAAASYYEQAKKAGGSVDNNIGMLAYRQGNYKKATENFKGDNYCKFNTALSYLMAGDNAKAKEVLDCINVDDRDGNYYYLYAILGARTNNLETVTSYLTRAIQLDGSLREKAASDMEFRKVRENEEFKNAIR